MKNEDKKREPYTSSNYSNYKRETYNERMNREEKDKYNNPKTYRDYKTF